VESTSYDHLDYPAWLNNLGISHFYRFEDTGNLQDIDYAISNHQKAVASTPSGHADLSSRLNNLGTSYLCRFEHTGNLQDIDHAISYQQKAVDSTPSGHAHLASRLNNLGNSYLAHFQLTQCASDIHKSIASYHQSAQANGIPSTRLKAARNAALQSSIHDKSNCLSDFALAISLLSEVAGLEQTIHCRHANLHGHSGLVQSAVALALHHNRPDLALVWLEQGRCLVWNQLNQLRTPMDNLHIRSSSLADRFVKIASALESCGNRSSSIISPYSTLTEHIHVQDLTRNHTILAAEYKQLLEEIRGLPDFHDFLQPSNATELLSSLPSNGPVIIFNVEKSQCDALVLISGIDKPLHIPLENFSLVEAETLWLRLQSTFLKQREVENEDRAGCPHPF
jgi:tetratricopeptide (TPR) repeat protein